MSHRNGYNRIDVTSLRLSGIGRAGLLRCEWLMGLEGLRQGNRLWLTANQTGIRGARAPGKVQVHALECTRRRLLSLADGQAVALCSF